jgi:hypothetical protein
MLQMALDSKITALFRLDKSFPLVIIRPVRDDRETFPFDAVWYDGGRVKVFSMPHADLQCRSFVGIVAIVTIMNWAAG